MRPGSFSATATSDGAGGSRQTAGYMCPFPLSEEELNKRKNYARRATKKLAAGLGAVGLLISGAVAAAYSGEGAQASLFAFLASVAVTLILMCLAMVAYWMSREQERQQIPTDPIYFPEIIEPSRDELWRAPTQLTYLEFVKTQLTNYEETAVNLSCDAVSAYNAISSIRSYSDYESVIKRLEALKSFKRDYDRAVPSLKNVIRTVLSGEVIEVINNLEAEIKKMQRIREEYDNAHKEQSEKAEAYNLQRQKLKSAWASTLGNFVKEDIRDIDLHIIQLEAYISELKKCDFKKLYKDLGLTEDWPAKLISIPELEEIKSKTDLMGSIREATQVSEPKTTAEEERAQKRKDCQQRFDSLQQDKEVDLSKMRNSGRTEEEIKRRENMWDDAIVREEEELRKWL